MADLARLHEIAEHVEDRGLLLDLGLWIGSLRAGLSLCAVDRGCAPHGTADPASGAGRDRYSRSAGASGSCPAPPSSGARTARPWRPSSRNQSIVRAADRPCEARMTLSRLPRALNQGADDPLRRALRLGLRRDRVKLGRVEEVDALDERVVHLLMPSASRVLLAPGHGAEADQADIEAGSAEAAVFHGGGDRGVGEDLKA